MRTIIVFATLIAVALAAPPQIVPQAVLVKETPSDNVGLGNYNYGYQLSDGQTKQEYAELAEGGAEGPFLKVQGSFSFVDPLTNTGHTVKYVADENGFHPQVEHSRVA